METILAPLRAANSRPARRAYITTFLLASGSIVLLGIAATTYILFYLNYIPQLSLSRPLYLQHHPTAPPSAHLILAPAETIPNQPYSVTLRLRMPLTPPNRALQNFMVHLDVLSLANTTLASSSRAAILTYRSPLQLTLSTVLRLPLLLAGLQREEETLAVVLLEEAVFAEEVGAVVVGLGSEVGVYEAWLEIEALLEGVRWWMWRYRVGAFLVGTGVFWGVGMAWMGVVWWGVWSYFEAVGRRKEGEEDGEERRRRGAYPTPEATPGLEEEEEAEADDEEEEEEEEEVGEEVVGVVLGDSGLGSMSESAGSSSLAKAVGEAGQRRRR